MKKKLFFFITCFFLLSSLTIFLTYRNIQLSEITKKKEKEVKRLLKELKEKEKSNLHQQEKNDENGDNQEETEEDLPWFLNYKGTIISLVLCIVIAVLIEVASEKSINIRYHVSIFNGFVSNFIDTITDENNRQIIADIILFVILFFGLSPALLAIFEYKDKSFSERYYLLWRSYRKLAVWAILGALLFFIVIIKIICRTICIFF